MLGFGPLGEFALGQAEPWTLKGKTRRNRGKIKYDYSVELEAPAPRRIKPKKFPPVSPEVRAMLIAQQVRMEALRRDDEEAVAVLLMTTH